MMFQFQVYFQSVASVNMHSIHVFTNTQASFKFHEAELADLFS